MDRVSGWYKRSTQLIIFITAIVVAVLANADTLMIANQLSGQATLRAALAAEAEALVRQPPPTGTEDAPQRLTTLVEQVSQYNLIGWSCAKP
jgi:archaellum component FlaG (FlaF/FlaG flagellin family)